MTNITKIISITLQPVYINVHAPIARTWGRKSAAATGILDIPIGKFRTHVAAQHGTRNRFGSDRPQLSEYKRESRLLLSGPPFVIVSRLAGMKDENGISLFNGESTGYGELQAGYFHSI